MNKEYKFYKYEGNPHGSEYCFCQRPCNDNMSLHCFLENGEILGFMSESLVFEHPEIKEIDMNTFMHEFVKTIIKNDYNLQQRIDKAIEILNIGILVPEGITKEEVFDIVNQRFGCLISILKGENNE